MIVVIDTNVWISALQFGQRNGPPKLAVERAVGTDILATCVEMEAEITRVLEEKFAWEPSRTRSILGSYLGRALEVEISGVVHLCRDPNDDMLLECALRAEADLLVSGDKDLLVMGTFQGTRIVTASQYLAEPLAPAARGDHGNAL